MTKIYKKKLDIFSFEDIIRTIGSTPRAPEKFTKKVYDVCARVPIGKVIDYKGIAHAIGTPAYQAIGQARTNAIATHLENPLFSMLIIS